QELYHLAQGGEAFPTAWFPALEDPKTGKPLSESMERFGLLRDPYAPDGLPAGLTSVTPRDLAWTGIKMTSVNCGSCHTGEVRYRGKSVRILGGQGFFDPGGFKAGLVGAIDGARKHPVKLLEFLARLAEHRGAKHPHHSLL